MRLVVLISVLVVLSQLSDIFAFQLFEDLFPDGKYCPLQELKTNEAQDHQSLSCPDPIVIRTKYPYLILWKENQEKIDENRIHVIQPHSWPDFIDLKSMSAEDNVMHFTLHNTSFHHHAHRQDGKSIDFTLKINGILLVQTKAFKRVQTPSTKDFCTMSNLVPGKWKYDPKFNFNTTNAWQTCPSLHENLEYRWSCLFQGLHYFPASNCHVLPLRQSLFLLYHHFQGEGLITNSTGHPYFFFFGDSLILQLCATGRCELHSHSNIILSQPSYVHSSSLRSLGYQARYKWNPFLRSDLPCSPLCLDETFRKKKGLKGYYRDLPGPCQGCMDGNISHRYPSNHPEVFYMLHDLPLSVKVLVLDAGAWFISENVKGEDSTAIFKETLEAFIPHLAYFQKQRNYEVDIYFLPLPGVDSSLAKSASYEWPKFEEKNRVLYKLFSPESLAVHNVTVTILPNDELFQRKHLISGLTNVFLHDNLHYCAPGTFSPDSFLFELLLHNHIVKKLSSKRM